MHGKIANGFLNHKYLLLNIIAHFSRFSNFSRTISILHTMWLDGIMHFLPEDSYIILHQTKFASVIIESFCGYDLKMSLFKSFYSITIILLNCQIVSSLCDRKLSQALFSFITLDSFYFK